MNHTGRLILNRIYSVNNLLINYINTSYNTSEYILNWTKILCNTNYVLNETSLLAGFFILQEVKLLLYKHFYYININM